MSCFGLASQRYALIGGIGLIWFSLFGELPAQMVQTNVGNNQIGSGYSESSGVAWSINGPQFQAQFGGGAPLLPPFGPPVNPTSFGFGFGGGGVSGGLRLFGGQSSSRSIVSSGASVTTIDGMPGQIQSGVIRPFVTGLVPIVGDYPGQTSVGTISDPAAASRNATLNSIANSKAAANHVRLQRYLQRAERAASEGKVRMSRANYRLALPLAPPEMRAEIQRRMRD